MKIFEQIKARINGANFTTERRNLATFKKSDRPPQAKNPITQTETVRARPSIKKSRDPELPASYVEMLRQLAECSYKGGRKDITKIGKKNEKKK